MDAYRMRPPWLVAGTSRRVLTAACAGLAGFVAVALLVALSAWPQAVDGWVERLVVRHRTGPVTVVARAFTFLGSGPGVIGAVIVFGAVLWLRTRRWLYSVWLAVTVALGAGVESLVKLVVGRPRPPADLVLGHPALTAAFPSGHTTNGTIAYLLAGLLLATTMTSRTRWAAVVVAGLVAVGIGCSRVYLGYHWCTDVVGGWLLGSSLAVGASALAMAWAARRTAPAPVPAAVDRGRSVRPVGSGPKRAHSRTDEEE